MVIDYRILWLFWSPHKLLVGGRGSLEGIAAVCLAEFCMIGVGETTSFPLCSTCLICFVLFVFTLEEMNG